MENKISYKGIMPHLSSLRAFGYYQIDEAYSKYQKFLQSLYMRLILLFVSLFTLQQIAKIYQVCITEFIFTLTNEMIIHNEYRIFRWWMTRTRLLTRCFCYWRTQIQFTNKWFCGKNMIRLKSFWKYYKVNATFKLWGFVNRNESNGYVKKIAIKIWFNFCFNKCHVWFQPHRHLCNTTWFRHGVCIHRYRHVLMRTIERSIGAPLLFELTTFGPEVKVTSAKARWQ